MPEELKESNGAKKYARYISIGSGHDLLSLVNVARAQGMRCISACKPGWCVFYEIGLYGTPAQMRRADQTWRAIGAKPLSRKPRAAFGVNLDREPESWADPLDNADAAIVVAEGRDQ